MAMRANPLKNDIHGWAALLAVLTVLFGAAESVLPFVVERYDDVFPWPHWINYAAIGATSVISGGLKLVGWFFPSIKAEEEG